MIQKVNNQIVKAFEKLYEQVFIVGKLTRDRIEGLILSWVNVFPMLESNHLQVSSYGVNVGMNPSLDVELIGDPLMINEHTLPGIIASLGNNRPAITHHPPPPPPPCSVRSKRRSYGIGKCRFTRHMIKFM
ncbi:MAG: hypothetical protein U0T81_14050 [Saprospiraceae bacterium]